MIQSNKRPHIVILEAGFGGFYTLKKLQKLIGRRADITLLNRSNHFLFTPLLHEVATAGLGPHHVVESLRELIYRGNHRLITCEITGMDLEKQIIHTDGCDVPFDYAVIALGSGTNFFGVEGAEQNSYTLKDLGEAARLCNRLIDQFETAACGSSPETQKQLLSFGIVGGGPTGVELAGEMAELFFNTFEKYYKGAIDPKSVSLHLIQAAPELLPMFSEPLRKRALEILQQNGVTVHLNAQVDKVETDKLIFKDGSVANISTVVWTGGTKPNTPEFIGQIPEQDKAGRLAVDDYLRLKNYPNIYALGDNAADLSSGEQALPGLAQVAVSQAKVVGQNIFSSIVGQQLTKHKYKSKGTLVSLGQWQAVGEIYGVLFEGMLAWWMWRTIYLFKFPTWRKRIKIAIDWTVNIFSARDITKI